MIHANQGLKNVIENERAESRSNFTKDMNQ